jgi:hypothetical protein
MDGLDGFLNGGGAAETPAPAAEAPQAQPVDPQPSTPAPAQADAGGTRDERGRFAPKGDPAPAEEPKPEPGASPAPKVDDPKLDHPALIAERRRRQEAERRVEELQARPNPQAPQHPATQPGPQAPAGPPDRFEDPEGYDNWLIATVTQRARAEAIAAHQEERIATSAEAARAKYPDWTDKASVFADLARANPALEQTLRNHPNPGEYAYSTAKLHLELQEHGSLEGLIAAREEAARAAARAEAERAGTIAPPAPVNIPQSLASSQSARSAPADAPSGPLSLEDILKRPRK